MQLFVCLVYFRFCVSSSPYFCLLTHFIFLIVSLRCSATRVKLFYCFISPLTNLGFILVSVTTVGPGACLCLISDPVSHDVFLVLATEVYIFVSQAWCFRSFRWDLFESCLIDINFCHFSLGLYCVITEVIIEEKETCVTRDCS